MIKGYTEGISRVNQLEKQLQSCRPAIHMRKRWGTLFVNVLNASVASSCCGYQKVNTFENIPHADFRRYITVVLIKSRDESIRENDKGSSVTKRSQIRPCWQPGTENNTMWMLYVTNKNKKEIVEMRKKVAYRQRYRDRIKRFEITNYKSFLIYSESKTAFSQLFHKP